MRWKTPIFLAAAEIGRAFVWGSDGQLVCAIVERRPSLFLLAQPKECGQAIPPAIR